MMTGFTEKQKRLIRERDVVCVPHGGACGVPPEYLVCHHRAGRGMGSRPSANVLENGLATCSLWNSQVEDLEPLMRQAFDNHWRLWRYEEPLDVPAYYPHLSGWYYLTDNGMKELAHGYSKESASH